jgi:hypothetical protein
MKAISYSLFGYNKQPAATCFEFNTYLRGLATNIRVNRVIYPGWQNILNIDPNTYNSPFKPIFDWYQSKGLLEINLCPDNEALCLAMLWRMKPIFFTNDGAWKYTHVLCRDIDSIGTFREAQAVAQWISEDKAMHCITDSISHNIPAMGGMIGFRPAYLSSRMDIRSWDQLMKKNPKIDFSRKGTDQDFLNRVVYPQCSDSATEHFILGMKRNIPAGNGRHYEIADIELPGVGQEHKFTNDLAGHIGASGYYEPPMMKFLKSLDPYRDEYVEMEKQFPQLFFWQG